MTKTCILSVVLCAALQTAFPLTARAAEALVGYHAQVKVAAPTRLDWIFAVANQSPAQPPAAWLAGYDSTEQRYELFVPENLDRRKPAPVVLFISAGDTPAGWSQWQTVCRKAGVIFASPFGAGNNCPAPRRARIVLDVIDDIARRQKIDPDRTYLGGFSGGSRIACGIVFGLPEYFGGVIPVCGAEKLREESWLRQRASDRISVALVTGEQDFNRAELERLREPMFTDVGVRTKRWTVAGLGHGIPDGQTLAPVFAWLEEGAVDRKRKATQWPAMRIGGSDVPSRSEWADALLKEAKLRLQKPATVYSGLMQLQGIATRWPDVAAADAALTVLGEYEARAERPWEADDIAEQRRYLAAEARSIDGYGSGALPAQYEAQRGGMLRKAIELWQQVQDDSPDSAAGKEAGVRIPKLQALLEKSQ
ncbi:MAG: hypothetical protein K8U03_00010 [Planctomycetia bacterium]|nr:hypothetical protein [Planctomycetia bacterium]